MNVKIDFDNINVFEENNPNNIKILMLKGEKGDTGSGADWGNIGGTITNQTDLMSQLNSKANSNDLSPVATSGSYNDLSNKPTIPDVNNMGNIVVDDVNCKNLWNFNYTETKLGVNTLYDNSTLTLNGTSSGDGFNITTPAPTMAKLKAGTYTLSLNEISGSKNSNQLSLVIRNITTATNIIDALYNGSGVYTFTLSADANICVMIYFRLSNIGFTNYKIELQLEQGSQVTSYTPYKSFDATAYVLWTNPDDTQSFANQLVSLNDALANYKYYEIIYKRSTTMSRCLSTGRIPTNKASDMITNLNYNYIRTISEIWARSFRISDCSYYATYGSTTSTTNNNFIIPYQILGYK